MGRVGNAHPFTHNLVGVALQKAFLLKLEQLLSMYL